MELSARAEPDGRCAERGAKSAMRLRTAYAMPGTELAYGPTRRWASPRATTTSATMAARASTS
eukprot:2815252-Rhodomonas_salina.1